MAGEKTVVVGFGHNMVIKQDNSVWATGWNLYGQFGYGSINSASTFIRVVTLSDTVVHDMDTLLVNWFPSGFSLTTKASSTGVQRAILSSMQHCFN